jgi:arginine decarboxylase
MGAALQRFDVGGGLAVHYDGSETNFQWSMNYTTLEYARDVVATVGEACDEKGIAHPDIVTETGRAMVAHHSLLIFNVLGVNEILPKSAQIDHDPGDHTAVHERFKAYQSISRKNVIEAYHDAVSAGKRR